MILTVPYLHGNTMHCSAQSRVGIGGQLKLRLLYLALTVALWAVLVAGSSGLVLEHLFLTEALQEEVREAPEEEVECLQEQEIGETAPHTKPIDPRDVPNWSGRVSFDKKKQKFIFHPTPGYKPELEVVPATEITSGLWIGSTLNDRKIWYDEMRDFMHISSIDLGRCSVFIGLDRLENGVFMTRKPTLICDK